MEALGAKASANYHSQFVIGCSADFQRILN